MASKQDMLCRILTGRRQEILAAYQRELPRAGPHYATRPP